MTGRFEGSEFNEQYFRDRYLRKNILGFYGGEKPFLYSFVKRAVTHRIRGRGRVSILEVGSGCGFLLRRLRGYGPLLGLDISEAAMRFAKDVVPEAYLVFGSAESLGFANRTLDAIIALDVIEHLHDAPSFLREAHRVLKADSVLFLSTPNPRSIGARLKKGAPIRTGESYHSRLDEWFGWRDDTHVSIKSMDDWRALLRSSGFVIERDGTDGLWDVPYVSFIPAALQKAILLPLYWAFSYLVGMLPWKHGENFLCIARKA